MCYRPAGRLGWRVESIRRKAAGKINFKIDDEPLFPMGPIVDAEGWSEIASGEAHFPWAHTSETLDSVTGLPDRVAKSLNPNRSSPGSAEEAAKV